MKITPKQYARGLQEITQGKSQAEIKIIVAGFLALLAKRGQLKLVKRISHDLEELLRNERGELLAELVSARSLSVESKKVLDEYIKKQTGEAKIIWQEQIDESLLGGATIKYQDKIIDISCKNILSDIKKTLTK